MKVLNACSDAVLLCASALPGLLMSWGPQVGAALLCLDVARRGAITAAAVNLPHCDRGQLIQLFCWCHAAATASAAARGHQETLLGVRAG
jgi:hypothetical protein